MKDIDREIESVYGKHVIEFVDNMNKLGLSGMTTWSQIEMASSVYGLNIDEDIFLFLLRASTTYKNIHEIMINGITHSKFLAEYASADKTADVLYRMTDSKFYWSVEFTHLFALLGDEMYQTNFRNSDLTSREQTTYELMAEFDKKFPLMFIRFFGRKSKMLCANNLKFVNWLIERTKAKAKSNPQFNQILKLIDKEKLNSMKTCAFMS